MAATKSPKLVFWVRSVYIFQDQTAPTYPEEGIPADVDILAIF